MAPCAQSLHVQSVVLHLDVEVLAEQLGEPGADLLGLVHLFLEDPLAELGAGAAGQADEAVVMGGEQLLVDARDVVVALQVGDAGHFDEVLEASGVLGQQRQMIAGLAAFLGLALGALARRDVRFVADDRIDAGGPALLVELDGAEQVAVVGDGAGVHAQFLDLRHQFRHPVGAVEEAVVTVAMEMNERTFRHARFLRLCLAATRSGARVRRSAARRG